METWKQFRPHTREYHRAYSRAWRKANPEANQARQHATHLMVKYGITQDEFEGLLAYQDGICVGCDKAPATQVDHDHETGDVRGLLCGSCNSKDALGTME